MSSDATGSVVLGRPGSEGRLVEVHQREVDVLGDPALGGQPGQGGLGEELRGRDLALVERLVLRRDGPGQLVQRDLCASQQQPGADDVAEHHQQPAGVEADLVDVADVAAVGGRVGAHQVVDHVPDDRLRVLERRGQQTSLDLEPAVAALGLDERLDLAARGGRGPRPWSLTILRKNRSWPWIAVVPSYRVSILASRTYCSIG